MTPSLPRRSLFPLLAIASLALSLLSGCGKTADEDDVVSDRQVEATPTPTPIPTDADRKGRKVMSAYNAVSGYLKDQDPDLREHLQKTVAKFVKDKDKWRERLANRQRDLQPRIARLREQLTKAEGQSAEALHSLRQELAGLESQRADAERKLAEIESITSDAWQSFRDRLGSDDEPAASPTPGKR